MVVAAVVVSAAAFVVVVAGAFVVSAAFVVEAPADVVVAGFAVVEDVPLPLLVEPHADSIVMSIARPTVATRIFFMIFFLSNKQHIVLLSTHIVIVLFCDRFVKTMRKVHERFVNIWKKGV